MRLAGAVLPTCAAILLLAGAEQAVTGGEKKTPTNAEKVLGKWQATKGEIPAGAVLEFTKDGKVKLTLALKGTEVEIAWSTLQGTYQIEGDKFKTTRKMGEKEVSDFLAIKTLNQTTLILESSQGKTEEFKKK